MTDARDELAAFAEPTPEQAALAARLIAATRLTEADARKADFTDWATRVSQPQRCRRGRPADVHSFSSDPKSRHYRVCEHCGHVRPPVLESITCHPGDRARLDEQLPTVQVFGEPLPHGTLILESIGVQLGTLRLRIEGEDMTVTFPPPPEPQRWMRVDPFGLPFHGTTPAS